MSMKNSNDITGNRTRDLPTCLRIILYNICYALSKHSLDAFVKLLKATISFVTSVRPSFRMENLGPHWKDFEGIWYLSIFRKSVQNNKSSLKSDKNNGYYTVTRTCRITSHWLLLKARNVSHRRCRENQNTNFMFGNVFPKIIPSMWYVENKVQPDRPQMTIWRMRIACWIPKATNTHP